MSNKPLDTAPDLDPMPHAVGAPPSPPEAGQDPVTPDGVAAAAADADADATAVAVAATESEAGEGEASSATPVDATAATAAGPSPLPGELLAARRKELRLSVDELAARVKLAPRQLVALESNDFASLPGMASVRGFVRSCAKAMGMDPEPLLALLAAEANPAQDPIVLRRPLPQQGFPGRRYAPSTSHRRGSRRLSGFAVVLLVFVGTAAFVAYRQGMPALPAIDLDAARQAVTALVPASATSTDASTASEAAAQTEAGAASEPAPAANGAPATVGAAAPASIDPARALELRLREDAWVEVLTQNGDRKLVSRLMKAGSTERIEVTEPVVLIVGNAAGVDVSLRGQPVNLKPASRDNVAKLNLK